MKLNTKELARTNIVGFLKDPKTGVVHNTNEDQLRAYIHGRESVKEIAMLKDELAQIKKALGI